MLGGPSVDDVGMLGPTELQAEHLGGGVGLWGNLSRPKAFFQPLPPDPRVWGIPK